MLGPPPHGVAVGPYETLECQVRDGVATVTLNRPDRLNAISARMKEELERVFFEEIAPSEDTRVVIVTGSGRAFCAGADVKERAAASPGAPATYFAQRRTHALFRRLAEFEKPTIAAINGLALGGGLEIALLCDFRIAAEGAQLGLPEVTLGIIPLGGGTQRLTRLVGAARAKALILTGDRIDAEEAQRIGLVNKVVPAGVLMHEAETLADRIASLPPLAVRLAKRVIDAGRNTNVESALELELYAGAILNDTEDRREGMQAFTEKRPPRFKGQ